MNVLFFLLFKNLIFIILFHLVDNVSGKKVHRKHYNEDFSLFLPAPADAQPKISPQLAFAIYQYLSTGMLF